MPIIKSALKKLRADARKKEANLSRKSALKSILAKARELKTKETVLQAVIALDKAAQKHLIHKNTANRKKSQLSKLLREKAQITPTKVKTTIKRGRV